MDNHPSTSPGPKHRRGIKRRLSIFLTSVESLVEIAAISPATARRSWVSMRRGIEIDPMLNSKEQEKLISTGDAIISQHADAA